MIRRFCSVLTVALLLASGSGGTEIVELIYHPCGDTPVFCFGAPRECDGLINNRGEILHRFQVSHEIEGPFNEGLIAAEFPTSGRWGYLDARGEWAIRPKFRHAWPFRGGLARVFDTDAGSMGFIDRAGDYVIPPRFVDVTDFDNEGFAAFHVGDRRTGDRRVGVIDRTGKVLVEPKLLLIGEFSGGYANAVLDHGACWLPTTHDPEMMGGLFTVFGGPPDLIGDRWNFPSEGPVSECRWTVIDTLGRPQPDADPATMIAFDKSWNPFPSLGVFPSPSPELARDRTCHGLGQTFRDGRNRHNEAAFVDETGKTVFAWKWRWDD